MNTYKSVNNAKLSKSIYIQKKKKIHYSSREDTNTSCFWLKEENHNQNAFSPGMVSSFPLRCLRFFLCHFVYWLNDTQGGRHQL